MKHVVRRSSLQMAKRGTELMVRNGSGPAIGGRPSRDEVAPWENMQLESEISSAAADNADTAVAAVRRKRASRVLSGSFFSRGS